MDMVWRHDTRDDIRRDLMEGAVGADTDGGVGLAVCARVTSENGDTTYKIPHIRIPLSTSSPLLFHPSFHFLFAVKYLLRFHLQYISLLIFQICGSSDGSNYPWRDLYPLG